MAQDTRVGGVDTITQCENVLGSVFTFNVLTGDAASNMLVGGWQFPNTISGGGGNDIVTGGNDRTR